MKITNLLAFTLIVSGCLLASCGDKKSANESSILNDSTANKQNAKAPNIDDVNYASGVIAALSLMDQLGAKGQDINADEISK